jgi:hypothetical protein
MQQKLGMVQVGLRSLTNMNTTRASLHGLEQQTAAIGAGGYSPTAVTELWNGTFVDRSK